MALVAVAGVLLAAGGVPSRLVLGAAGFLFASGAWSVLSVAWGGLPNEAWTTFDQSAIGAAALIAGSLVSRPDSLPVVGLAVLVGFAAQAGEVLARLALSAYPAEWLYGRTLEGPVSDHNAQAVLFALGIPLAVWLTSHHRRLVRFASGAAASLLLGGLLLTQSRGTIIALGLALLVQLVWARSAQVVLVTSLVVGAGVALFFPLRDVDAALVAGQAADRTGAFRTYALWAGLAALILGALATPTVSRLLARRLAVGLGAIVLAGAVGYSVTQHESLERAREAVQELASDEPPEAEAGATRFGRFSLPGRRDAWRISREMAAEEPLLGAGEGQFAPRWAVERRLTGLYIIQPHSLEFELLSELGIVGLALFAGFVILAVLAVGRGPDRLASAAVLGALILLLARASIDYTWSLPGLVAPTLLLVGAAATPASWRRFRSGLRAVLVPLAVGVLAVALLASLGAPFLADRHLARATALAATDPDRSEAEVSEAHRLNPWQPEIASLQGRLAEAGGQYRLAAERYRTAAGLSFFPWLEQFKEARALARANALGASRAACRVAIKSNPGEQSIRTGPCGGDLLVSSSPDRSKPLPLDGATVRGEIYVFATAPDEDAEVRFYLDDPGRTGEPLTEERVPPFDLAGGLPRVTSGEGPAKPFHSARLENGKHTLTVVIEGRQGEPRIVSATFTVSNPA